jgi:hypothetical protein
MTMRAFVRNTLTEKGLDVRDDDLRDLRKERKRSAGTVLAARGARLVMVGHG